MVDLSLYAGRWIALTENNAVASVGVSLADVQHTGRLNRPKEYLRYVWIAPSPPYIAIPAWPLAELSTVLPKSGVWLAGGPVRDLLLKRPLHDWDFAVAAHGLRLARKVANALGAAYYPLDVERDTGRAVAKKPGTHHMITLDFARLRGTNIAADLKRRDFTINAMALTLDGRLIDPTGGQQDLAQRCIRATSDQTFSDDPARLLRAVRQSHTLGFDIEPHTRQLILAQAAAIQNIAPERVRTELFNMLTATPCAASIQALHNLTLLPHILPEVAALHTVVQSWPHYYARAWEHTLATVTALEGIFALLAGKSPRELTARTNAMAPRVPALRWAWTMLAATTRPLQTPLLDYLNTELNTEMPRATLLKWSALLHDIGKTATRTVDAEGRVHFYGHAERGAILTQTRLTALHFPKKALKFIRTLVANHMRLISLGKQPPSRRAVYRFYRHTGDAGVGIILLALADTLAVWVHGLEQSYWQTRLASAQSLLTTYFDHQNDVIAPPPLLTGNDLLALGIPQGRQIGQLLAALQEAQAAGEIQDRIAAEAFVRENMQLCSVI